jgi:hypothetical protein
MKVHLTRIAVIALAVIGPLLATPAAASPKDPDSFLVTPLQQDDCYFGASFGDPLNGLCPFDVPELATIRLVSGSPGGGTETGVQAPLTRPEGISALHTSCRLGNEWPWSGGVISRGPRDTNS